MAFIQDLLKKLRKVKLKEIKRTLTVEGLERSYLVFIPEQRLRKKHLPVILGFHGLFGAPQSFSRHTRLNQAGGDAGYITVFPEGYKKSWNAGGVAGELRGIDDVAFVRAVLDDLKEVADYDSQHVFSAGFSNGGKFSYRLACELSSRIRAIASVSGGMDLPKIRCVPEQAVPVLHFHGLKDPVSPFEGGPSVVQFIGRQPSIPATIRFWREVDECPEEPVIKKPKPGVTFTAYGPCLAGSAVLLYTFAEEGHQWPGSPAIFKKQFGPGTNAVSATEKIVEFFNSYLRQG